jgi:type 1 glutamine amidotransferase
MKCFNSTARWTTFLLLCAALDTHAATKIVLIGKDRDHPYRTHEYMADSKLLAKCLEQTPNIKAVVSNGWPKDPAVLADADAIVLHVAMGGDFLFHKSHRKQAQGLLDEGVGLTAIHWSTGAAAGDVGEQYLKALGGWFNTEFSQYHVRESIVQRVAPQHPVSRGWESYPLREEFYVNLKFLEDIRPIATAEVNDHTYTIGWTYDRPGPNNGRSFGFVGGHFHENFANPPFCKSIVNGVLWTAHIDLPDAGAPCDVTEKDMELPPDTRKE